MNKELSICEWLKSKMIESQENYKGTQIKENYGTYTFTLDKGNMLCKIMYWYPKEIKDNWVLSEDDIISVSVASGDYLPFQLRREDFKIFLDVIEEINKKE